MDERASFEARPVLEPKRARLARLTLVLPAVALVAFAWAGLSGARPDRATAAIPDSTASPAATAAPFPRLPAKALGLSVHRLDDVEPRELGRDGVIAIAGWYVLTAVTDCPPLAAIYRDGALPEMRPDLDSWAFCVRSGVFYGSQPGPDDRASAGVSAVPARLVIGVVTPPELEVVGAAPTEIVVLGHFVETGDGCQVRPGCRPTLIVDHVAWTPYG